jgi:hypothetical protein
VQDFKGKVAGFKVDAVDTTGAGDSFVGGILNILASDPNLYKVQFNVSLAFEQYNMSSVCFIFFFCRLSTIKFLSLSLSLYPKHT